MPVIPSDPALARHPKLIALARALGISRVTALGHLHLLWYWVQDYTPDGIIGMPDAAMLAEAMQWEGDPDTLLTALLDAGKPLNRPGFLEYDADGLLRVHDWGAVREPSPSRRKPAPSGSSTSRTADWRARQRAMRDAAVTQTCDACDADVTDASHDVTRASHDDVTPTSHDVTDASHHDVTAASQGVTDASPSSPCVTVLRHRHTPLTSSIGSTNGAKPAHITPSGTSPDAIRPGDEAETGTADAAEAYIYKAIEREETLGDHVGNHPIPLESPSHTHLSASPPVPMDAPPKKPSAPKKKQPGEEWAKEDLTRAWFETFWSRWPSGHRTGKQDGWAAYHKLMLACPTREQGERLRDEIEDRLTVWLEGSTRWQAGYVKACSHWLSAAWFRDEPAQSAGERGSDEHRRATGAGRSNGRRPDPLLSAGRFGA